MLTGAGALSMVRPRCSGGFAPARRFQLEGRIAQVVEQLPFKQRVTGSSPVAPTNFKFKGPAGNCWAIVLSGGRGGAGGTGETVTISKCAHPAPDSEFPRQLRHRHRA